MEFNDAGRNLLRRLEGCRLDAYVDEAGVLTVGYGHTGPDVRPGMHWTQEQVDVAFDRDVDRFATGMRQLVGIYPLNSNQFSAMVVFAYNIGLEAFADSSALRRIRNGLMERVPAAMQLFDKIHDPKTGLLTASPILQARRRQEAALWNAPFNNV